MVTMEVKEDSKQAKAFIALAKTLSFVEIKESVKTKNNKVKTKEYPVSKNVPNATKVKKTPRLNDQEAEEFFEKMNYTSKEKAFYRKFRKAVAEARAIEAGEMEGIPLEKTLNEI